MSRGMRRLAAMGAVMLVLAVAGPAFAQGFDFDQMTGDDAMRPGGISDQSQQVDEQPEEALGPEANETGEMNATTNETAGQDLQYTQTCLEPQDQAADNQTAANETVAGDANQTDVQEGDTAFQPALSDVEGNQTEADANQTATQDAPRDECLAVLPEEVTSADNETYAEAYLTQMVLYYKGIQELLSVAEQQTQDDPRSQEMVSNISQDLDTDLDNMTQLLQERYGAEEPELNGTGIGDVVEQDRQDLEELNGTEFWNSLFEKLMEYETAAIDSSHAAIEDLDDPEVESIAAHVIETQADHRGKVDLFMSALAHVDEMMAQQGQGMHGGAPPEHAQAQPMNGGQPAEPAQQNAPVDFGA